jgi:hypothetical protein
MKKCKPFSRKYYAETLKSLARALIRSSSHCGRLLHDGIEGVNHENDAWKFGGSACVGFEDDQFEYQIYVKRKSRRERGEV